MRSYKLGKKQKLPAMEAIKFNGYSSIELDNI